MRPLGPGNEWLMTSGRRLPATVSRLTTALVPLALLLAACSSPSTDGPGSNAAPSPVTSEQVPVERTADLLDPEGSVLGYVTIRQSVTDTGTEVEVQASGLAEGEYPLTLLDAADCSTSGGTLAPSGAEVPDAELAGLVVEANGVGEVTAQVAPDLGDLLDDDGSALVAGPPATSPGAGPTGSQQACAAFGG